MTVDRVTDGRRIAELLSSELHGREDGHLDGVVVVDAREEVTPTEDGARAYGVAVETAAGDSEPLGAVYVHPDRAHVALRAGLDAAVEAAREAGLRVRPKAVHPPEALVFVESGAEAKRAADAVAAAAGAVE